MKIKGSQLSFTQLPLLSTTNVTISESESEVVQSCPTLCDPMDCSLPGSSLHRIFQARVLERVAVCISRGSSQPRDRTGSPALHADALPSEPPGKPTVMIIITLMTSILALRTP